MQRITYDDLKKVAKILGNTTGLNVATRAGNGCFGLVLKLEHGEEWILNGMTKRQLNDAMWGIIRTVKFMENEK